MTIYFPGGSAIFSISFRSIGMNEHSYMDTADTLLLSSGSKSYIKYQGIIKATLIIILLHKEINIFYNTSETFLKLLQCGNLLQIVDNGFLRMQICPTETDTGVS